MTDKFLYFGQFDQATTTITPNSDVITLTAVKSGADGNLISVQIRHDDSAGTVTTNVTGTRVEIIVGIGTGNNKDAGDIVGYINGDATAASYVTASGSGSNNAAADYDSGTVFLFNGDKSVCFPASSFAGMAPIDDTHLGVYFKSINNFDGYDATDGAEVISDFVSLTVDSDHDHKGMMNEICEALNSPSGGYGLITVATEASQSPVIDASFIHQGITGVSVTVKANIS